MKESWHFLVSILVAKGIRKSRQTDKTADRSYDLVTSPGALNTTLQLLLSEEKTLLCTTSCWPKCNSVRASCCSFWSDRILPEFLSLFCPTLINFYGLFYGPLRNVAIIPAIRYTYDTFITAKLISLRSWWVEFFVCSRTRNCIRIIRSNFWQTRHKKFGFESCCGSFGHRALAFPAHYTHVA